MVRYPWLQSLLGAIAALFGYGLPAEGKHARQPEAARRETEEKPA